MKKEKTKGKKSREEKGILFLILLITLSVITAIAINLYERSRYDNRAEVLDKTDLYQEQVKEQLKNQGNLSDFHFRVSGQGEFPKGTKSAGNLFIENPADNHYKMQVIIKSEKTGEELYCSKVLSPGENESSFALKKALPKGEQRAAAYIRALEGSGEAQKLAGEVTAEIYLEVGPNS